MKIFRWEFPGALRFVVYWHRSSFCGKLSMSAQEGMFSLGGGMEGILGSQVSIAYGAWIVTIAGICVPFAGYLFRNKSFRRV